MTDDAETVLLNDGREGAWSWFSWEPGPSSARSTGPSAADPLVLLALRPVLPQGCNRMIYIFDMAIDEDKLASLLDRR